jgi:uncharacterized membrane protein
MARIEESIVIDAPRTSVWFTLLRFRGYPEWMEGVHEVRKTGEDTLHWRATVAGHEYEWDAEIVAIEDNELLEWHARGDGPNDVRIQLEPAGPRGTRVTINDRFRPRGLVERAAEALGLGKRRLRSDLENLKQQLESTGSASS